MKKSTVIGIIAFMATITGLISSPVAVQAYQALTLTPTRQPTITAPPPYNPMINTPANLGDLDCPEDGSNPSGWGTVTPSSGWMMLCSECVSSSEWGTSTPSNTRTPNPTFSAYTQAACQTAAVGGEPCLTPTGISTTTPTSSPTPNVTATPNTEFFLQCVEWWSDNSTCESMAPGHLHYEVDAAWHEFDAAAAYKLIWSINWSLWHNVDIYVQSNLTYLYEGLNLNFFAHPEWYSVGHVDGMGFFHSWTTPSGSINQLDVMTVNNDGDKLAYYRRWEGWTITGTGIRGTIDIYSYPPVVIGTPTPIVTPTPSAGYCKSVSSTESGFSWSGITIGETQCFDIGPYEFDFWGLMQPEEEPLFTMPWIAHVCAQDISFGEITVFDVVISLETILYILMFAAVIRNMFVS
jgi:hypothetical protein